MNRFLKAYSEISDLSAALMTLGTKLALCVLAVGISAYKYNEWLIGGFGNEQLSIQIVQAAWNMFAVIILGGMVLDCAEKEK